MNGSTQYIYQPNQQTDRNHYIYQANTNVPLQTNTTVVGAHSNLIMAVIPYGTVVRNDINPIARLNFGVNIFNNDCNQIDNIELTKVNKSLLRCGQLLLFLGSTILSYIFMSSSF